MRIKASRINSKKLTKQKLQAALDRALKNSVKLKKNVRDHEKIVRELELHRVELDEQNRELQESHQLLEESRNRHIDLYDFSPVGYLTMDEKGVIRLANMTAASLLQVEASYLVGKPFSQWIYPDHRIDWGYHLQRCLEAEPTEKIITELSVQSTQDRKQVSVQLHSVVMADLVTGKNTFRTAVIDFSDRKRAEEAEAASEAKSNFLANMSHEIRTPLGAILGFVELLAEPNIVNDQRELYLEVIRRNGVALQHLIDDILDLSKVEAGRLEIEKVEFSLPELLNELNSYFRVKAEEKGLNLNLIYDREGIENIVSDPTRLRQILLNIIGNAIKFTEYGSVTIAVRCIKADDLHQHLRIAVIDTGPGVSPSQRHRLFQNFTQADCSTTRKFGGTGLGLALSRHLARALGGDVILENSEGFGSNSGSTFWVDIKVGVPQPSKAVLFNARSADHERTVASPRTKMHVLVVEDSEDNQLLIRHLLAAKGMYVEFASNGVDGIRKALGSDFDVVLMDIQMPVLDGLSAARQLRRSGYKKPIVALSAHAMKEDHSKSLAAGCDGHMTKPISPKNFADSITSFAKFQN